MMPGMSPDDLFGHLLKSREPARPYAELSKSGQRQRRAECNAQGHKYKVQGKISPGRLSCGHCDVAWAIGPRTNPPEAPV
jgi:hypothetical protein